MGKKAFTEFTVDGQGQGSLQRKFMHRGLQASGFGAPALSLRHPCRDRGPPPRTQCLDRSDTMVISKRARPVKCDSDSVAGPLPEVDERN